jgi:hypothetical protein
MERKVYKIDWNNEEDGLLYGVSIVDSPANQYEFIQFSKEKLKLSIADEKKKLLVGVVLVPEQKIARYTKERGEFDIVFDQKTIEKLAHNFLTQEGFNKNNWYNHDKKEAINNSVVVESWLLSSETKDKAFALGYSDLPTGTWCIVMKLSDKDWAEYIETGKAKGFSIDSYLKLEQLLFSDIEETKEQSIKNKITQNMENYLKKFLKFSLQEEEKKEEVKMLEIPQEEGEALTVASLEVGQMVMRGEEVISNSEFTFEGKVYKTDAEGMISEISDVEPEAEPEVEVEAKDKEEQAMSLEEQRTELYKMVDENPEIEKMLREKFETKKDDKEKMEMSALAEKNAKIKSDLEKEITELKLALENTPNSGKLKGGVEVNLNERRGESTLTALNRIAKTSK